MQKTLYKSLILSWLLLIWASSNAQSQTLLYDSTAYLTATTSASPVGDGWLDAGNKWSVVSHQLIASATGGIPTNVLFRPTSETAASLRVVQQWDETVFGGTNSWNMYVCNSASTSTGYLIFAANGGAITIKKYPGSTTIVSGTGNTSYTLGGAGGPFSTPSVVTLNVKPNTTAGYDVTVAVVQAGVTVRTATLTGDTTLTAGIQWRYGLTNAVSLIPTKSVQIYDTGTNPLFSLSQTSAVVNGSPVNVTVTGNAYTNWTSGTTFSVTGGTGASITSQSINVGAQTASLTINTGSSALTGPLVISNGTDSPSTSKSITLSAPTFTVSGGSVVVGSSGNALTLVGSGTAWTSGTVFSLVGAPTGTTLASAGVATTFVDATHVTLTLNAGSTLGTGATITYSNVTGAITGSGTVSVNTTMSADWTGIYPGASAKALKLTGTGVSWAADAPTAKVTQGARGNVGVTLGSVSVVNNMDGTQTVTIPITTTTASHGLFNITLTNGIDGPLLSPTLRCAPAAIFVTPGFPAQGQTTYAVNIIGLNTIFQTTSANAFTVSNPVGFSVNPTFTLGTRTSQTTATGTLNTGTLTSTSVPGKFDLTDSASGAVWNVTVNNTAGGLAGAGTKILYGSPIGNFIDGRVAATNGNTAYTFQYFRGATMAAVQAAIAAGTSPLVDGAGISGATTPYLDDESTVALSQRMFYGCKVLTVTSNPCVSVVMQPSLNICCLGDSITNGATGELPQMVPILQTILGYRYVKVVGYGNSGAGLFQGADAGGANVNNWNHYEPGSIYASAKAVALASGCNAFSIMLGTNDSIYGGTTQAQFVTAANNLMTQLRADFGSNIKIFWQCPLWNGPGSSNLSLDRLITYQNAIFSLADNTNVFVASRDLFDYFSLRPDFFGTSDLVHPLSTPTQTLTTVNGQGQLLNMWAVGIARALLPLQSKRKVQ